MFALIESNRKSLGACTFKQLEPAMHSYFGFMVFNIDISSQDFAAWSVAHSVRQDWLFMEDYFKFLLHLNRRSLLGRQWTRI